MVHLVKKPAAIRRQKFYIGDFGDPTQTLRMDALSVTQPNGVKALSDGVNTQSLGVSVCNKLSLTSTHVGLLSKLKFLGKFTSTVAGVRRFASTSASA